MKTATALAAPVMVAALLTQAPAATEQPAPTYSASWDAPTCKPRAVHLTLVNDTDEPARFHIRAWIVFRHTQLWKDRRRNPEVPAGSTVTVTFRPSKSDGNVFARVRVNGTTVLDTDEHTDAVACDKE